MRSVRSVGATEDASQAADPGVRKVRQWFALRRTVTTRRSREGAAPLSEDAL